MDTAEMKLSHGFTDLLGRIHERMLVLEELEKRQDANLEWATQDALYRVRQLLRLFAPEDLVLAYSGYGDPSDRSILRKAVAFAKTGRLDAPAWADVYPALFPDLSK